MAAFPSHSPSPIPFNRSHIPAKALEYMQQAMENGHISGNGPFTRKCEEMFSAILGTKALLTTSCTDALEMTGLLLDVGPGDEVIVPSFTFVSTVNAFVLRGAGVVFSDIRPDTLNMDHSALDRLITPRTKAIVPVHYAGVGCEMNAVQDVARRHGVALVEDNAHGLFGKYNGQLLGTFGRFATLSFHETKNISCGEGGALLMTQPDDFRRAEILREKGTDRARFFRGEVDKYSWVDVGSSFLPSDLLAALLYSQLEERETIQRARKRIWDCYASELAGWAGEHKVRLPFVPGHCEQPFHMFYLLMPSVEQRDALISFLKTRQILSVFHYLPLHLSAMAQRCAAAEPHCPVTEDVSGRLVRLPFYTGLSESDQMRVVDAVHEFQG
ncbi:MAG: dTDP-4-amino-4,6-dideoxygalactose transaminase [Acidobacteriia bacterium]|nr:dTDP-4-amino-4,6-dideoxygalactose transaminase [Terriglobia bacterium]